MPVVHLRNSSLGLESVTSWMASDTLWGQFVKYLQRCPDSSGAQKTDLLAHSPAISKLAIALVRNLKITFNFYFSLLFISENTD